jgi:gas vesicle protein
MRAIAPSEPETSIQCKRSILNQYMSQQDNFSGGFLLGAIVGGAVGGVLGALLTAQRLTEETEEETSKPELAEKKSKRKRRSLAASSEQNIELARRSLEDKIAQLNDAIDVARQQLGSVNGHPDADRERSLSEE